MEVQAYESQDIRHAQDTCAVLKLAVGGIGSRPALTSLVSQESTKVASLS